MESSPKRIKLMPTTSSQSDSGGHGDQLPSEAKEKKRKQEKKRVRGKKRVPRKKRRQGKKRGQEKKKKQRERNGE